MKAISILIYFLFVCGCVVVSNAKQQIRLITYCLVVFGRNKTLLFHHQQSRQKKLYRKRNEKCEYKESKRDRKK